MPRWDRQGGSGITSGEHPRRGRHATGQDLGTHLCDLWILVTEIRFPSHPERQ